MFRLLIIAAASLGIAIAYAANPTANLPITIVPPGGPPPPPNDPSAPQPAVAAGFNTLAIDFDFTQSSPWSDRSRWLRCHDGSGASSPILYQDWVGFGGWQMPPCTNIAQETDPFSSLALHLHMSKSDINGMGCEPNCNNSVLAMTLQTVNSAGNGNQLPANSYVEVIGMPRTSDPTMRFLFADFWSYVNDSGVEWDGIEWFGGPTGFATYHNNSSGSVRQTNEANSMDQSAYHTYAWRVTSDGHSDGYFCSYLDNAPAASAPGNCISWSPTSTQLTNPGAATVQFETGFSGCPDGSSCPNNSVELWVRRLRVWTCDHINSGAKCYSSSPNP